MLAHTRGERLLDTLTSTERSPSGAGHQCPGSLLCPVTGVTHSSALLGSWMPRFFSATPCQPEEKEGPGEACPLDLPQSHDICSGVMLRESMENYGVLPAQGSNPGLAEAKSLLNQCMTEPLIFPFSVDQ